MAYSRAMFVSGNVKCQFRRCDGVEWGKKTKKNRVLGNQVGCRDLKGMSRNFTSNSLVKKDDCSGKPPNWGEGREQIEQTPP